MTDLKPALSKYYKLRKPSTIRCAQIEFLKRTDNVQEINTAIGNVSLPMYPAMIERMRNLGSADSIFKDGVVKYSPTKGYKEANDAFLNIISSGGFKTDGLYTQVTDGGSHSMELAILGTCGLIDDIEKPLLLIDAAYTNYISLAKRTRRNIISVLRGLQDNGTFTLPDIQEIDKVIETKTPSAMIVIPYDNPTGQFFNLNTMIELAKLCVKHNIWMISDEAYRELHYVDHDTVSIWGLTNKEVPGIEGRRISIETASKVWNACGLRVGALITDNKEFHIKSVAENTANLCSNVIGQYIFGALAKESHNNLKQWYSKQRKYYSEMMSTFTNELNRMLPGIIISNPEASIYSVIDVKNIVEPGFDAMDFVMYCAQKGKVEINGNDLTLLVAPMSGFYNVNSSEKMTVLCGWEKSGLALEGKYT